MEKGLPPLPKDSAVFPGKRINAIYFPHGDQTGYPSISTDGEIQLIV
jgi:hypothetical protein